MDLEDLEMMAIYSGDPKMVPRDHWFNDVMPFSMIIGEFAMVVIDCYTRFTRIARSFRVSPQYRPRINRIGAVIVIYLGILFLVG